jgi:hypothetical protein
MRLKLLLGLKHIYCDKELHQAIFDILKTVTPEKVDSKKDRRNGFVENPCKRSGTGRKGPF